MIDRGPWLSTATALFFAWALLSCAVRIWVTRGRKQTWAYSDSGIASAAIFAMVHVGANFWAVGSGYGCPIAEIGESRKVSVEKALFMGQLSYIASIGLSRVSTAFFIGQLTRHPPQVRVSHILAGIAGGWTTVSALLVALRGELSRPWAVLDGTHTLFRRWVAVEILGFAVEMTLWLLSVSLVWGLQMKRRKQILILAAFGCRLFLIPIISIRLYYLAPHRMGDPMVMGILPHILTDAAMNYALASTSIISLKPFLKPFHSGAVLNTIGRGEPGLYSGMHIAEQGIYMLTPSSKHRNHAGSSTGTTTDFSNGDRIITPTGKVYASNSGEVTTVISSRPNAHPSHKPVNHDALGQLVIQRTTEWNVQYDSNRQPS